MKKIGEKFNKKLVTLILVAAMVIGVAADTGRLTGQPSANEIGKFDPVFYAQAYPDVAAAIGTDADALYSHYVTCGQAEGRIPYAGAAAGGAVDGIADTAAPVTDATAAVQAAPSGTVTHSWEEARQLWYQGLPHGYQPDYSQYEYTPEQLAMLAQKQAEFDAGGYVHVGWTEEQVYDRMMWIKENLYPEGTVVGYCSDGAACIYSNLYGTAMKLNCGWDMDWQQELFPDGVVSPMNAWKTGRPDDITVWAGHLKDRIRVGDVIYTTNAERTGHVSVVLTHNDRGITVVEANIGGDRKMHWGRFISWDELYNGRNSNRVGGCSHIEHYLY